MDLRVPLGQKVPKVTLGSVVLMELMATLAKKETEVQQELQA